jgi:hypothetical protein
VAPLPSFVEAARRSDERTTRFEDDLDAGAVYNPVPKAMSTKQSASVYRDVLMDLTAQQQKVGSGRDMIVVVGIDRYRSWPRLANAVNDAKGVLELFTGLGFEAVVPPLLQEKATADAMRRFVADNVAALSQSDNLLLFYAGHGHTNVRTFEDGTSVKTGYVVAADADEPGGSTAGWLRLDAWLSPSRTSESGISWSSWTPAIAASPSDLSFAGVIRSPHPPQLSGTEPSPQSPRDHVRPRRRTRHGQRPVRGPFLVHRMPSKDLPEAWRAGENLPPEQRSDSMSSAGS